VLATPATFELRSRILLPPTDEVLFAQLTKATVAGPLGIIVRLLSIGTEVRVQQADGAANLITLATISRPSGWTSWSIHLDFMTGLLVVKGGVVSTGPIAFSLGNTGTLDVFLLAYIDAIGATPTPSVEFDDIAACVP
jgi:hypothetical protein